MTALSARHLAKTLGGDARGDQVLAPGPGHTPQDRSLSIKLDPNSPDGFVVNSFAGDDPIACKDYVREKAGLGAFRPNGQHPRQRQSPSTSINRPMGRHTFAFSAPTLNNFGKAIGTANRGFLENQRGPKSLIDCQTLRNISTPPFLLLRARRMRTDWRASASWPQPPARAQESGRPILINISGAAMCAFCPTTTIQALRTHRTSPKTFMASPPRCGSSRYPACGQRATFRIG